MIKIDDRSTKLLGRRGEDLAAAFLHENGYRIIIRNFKVPVGRNRKGVSVSGEIDIIALDGETLCFIEVKTRRSESFVPITKNIDLRKQRQIIRTSKVYRRLFDLFETPVRYDAVTVLLNEIDKPRVELLRAFFTGSAFRERRRKNFE